MITNATNWLRPVYQDNETINTTVTKFLREIETHGDSSIVDLCNRFDDFNPQWIPLKPFDEYALEPELAAAIQLAAKRIERFAQFQKAGLQSQEFSDESGTYGQVVSPIERVGVYIPGGRFPLISTALMTLIPARVAGSPVRIACSPSANPALLAAASLAGATRFLQIGGVQAIGALTFGYQSMTPVDLIVGPGNAFVNEAKKQVQGKIKIDGLAGPSELLAICDGQQPIEWLALDALAQAEHDPMACSLIVCDNFAWLTRMLTYLENKPETLQLLDSKQIELIYAPSVDDLISFSDRFAPEHLMLCHQAIEAKELNHYGSLFIGANSAVALGDYISGPNHTLPTLGYAKQSGGLSVNTFLRIQTTQSINDDGRVSLARAAQMIAEAEGLDFHAQSLRVRST